MSVHPQSLFLALAGLHMTDDPTPLSGTSIVFVMGELGVGEAAARSVLQRNAAKGFIVRRKDGRKTFYTVSEPAREILLGGGRKMFVGERPRDWDGRWTLVRIQVPESKRALRHRLSSRLSWAGFGRIDGGTWVAPAKVDVEDILGEEACEVEPVVVYGELQPPTTDAMLVDAFDLDELGVAYEAFGKKWRACAVSGLSPTEALVRRVELHFDWLTLTRTDPQLPPELLPDDWPGFAQWQLFRELNERLGEIEEPALDQFFAGGLG